MSEIAARRSFLSGIAVALADAAGRRAPALPDDLAARALEAIEAARDVIERRRGPSEGRNLWGEAVSFPIGLGPDTLAPGIGAGRPRQDPPADALARELVRLGQPVRPPRDVLPHERGPVRLTAAEHLRLRALEGHEIRRDGRTLREALSRIVAGHDAALSPAYAAADDGDKAALLADAARRYRVAARAALVAETPALAAETGDDLRPAFAL